MTNATDLVDDIGSVAVVEIRKNHLRPLDEYGGQFGREVRTGPRCLIAGVCVTLTVGVFTRHVAVLPRKAIATRVEISNHILADFLPKNCQVIATI